MFEKNNNNFDLKTRSVNNVANMNRTVAVVPKYAPMLYTLLALLFLDFLLNSFNELAKSTAIAMLVLYM